MGQSNYVHLDDCTIVSVREKAMLVRFESGEEHWLPLSQVYEQGKNLKQGDGPVTVTVTEWIARQKGIEVD